jgi:hypothetical protein
MDRGIPTDEVLAEMRQADPQLFGALRKCNPPGQAAFGLFTVSMRSRILPRSRLAT